MSPFREIPCIIKRKSISCDGCVYEYELRGFEGREVASFGILLYEIHSKLTTNDGVSFYKTGGLFSSLEKAVAFFEFLSENLASPMSIPYIVEDSFSF